MRTAVDIYKLLPKTNCGTCGTASCMGFAAKLATRQAKAADCPNMTPSAREALVQRENETFETPGTVFEQTLRTLKPKIAALDFPRIAAAFGAGLIDPDTLDIEFLNERYIVTRENITHGNGNEPEALIAILIGNHLCMPDPPAPAGEWLTFASVPASHAKDKSWAGHVEAVIAAKFSGNVPGLRLACERMGGVPANVKGNQDAAYAFRFFPRYPALLLFFDAISEENFPAQCTLLLDKNVDRYLDIESIVVLGEEFAGRLTA
jgi:hypothetical protein